MTLTRRVFRDGVSEYFLNKTPCRLKDIQQLFMGTGVGRTSYSIMAQGNITQILSSKPEDRRMIFEEAAGITKFKSQKKESLRKLESTEQNLLRVADLIREVKRQIGSLQRQAGKARRYKQLMLELQHLDTQLARHQFDVLQAEIQARAEAVGKSRAQIESLSETVLRAENEISVLREQLSEQEQQIGQWQQRGLELKGEMDRHESRIQFNEERLRELDAQNAKAASDITQAEERHLAAQQELDGVTANACNAAAAALRAASADAGSQAPGACKVWRTICARDQEALRAGAGRARSPPRSISAAPATKSPRWICRSRATPSGSKNFPPKKSSLKRSARLGGALQQFSASVEAEKLKRADPARHGGGAAEAVARIQQQLNETTQRTGRAAAAAGRETFAAERAGTIAGPSTKVSTPARWPRSRRRSNVLGSLADKIRVPDQYVVAIETALGHHLQLVLTEQPESARQILAT